MIYEFWKHGETFQEVLYYVREFIVNNGIKDARLFHVPPDVRAETNEVTGYMGVLYYTKDKK